MTGRRNTLSNVDESLKKEWLVTNGLGGYASSTILGINTRKYHGLLVAAFDPPVDRRVVVSKLDEEILVGKSTYMLGANQFEGLTYPRGYEFIREFTLAPFPTYTYSVNKLQLQKTIFMPRGKNVTIVLYKAVNEHDVSARLLLKPLLNCRHFHAVTERRRLSFGFVQETEDRQTLVSMANPKLSILVRSTIGEYSVKEQWIEKVYYRVDHARGEAHFDDYFQPGVFQIEIGPNAAVEFALTLTADKTPEKAKETAAAVPSNIDDLKKLQSEETTRRRSLLSRFQTAFSIREPEEWLKWLVLATDAFVVHRASTNGKSVIAGYHWFEDWGRDTFISLPGLLLVTQRTEEAKQVFLTFKQYCRQGLIPNHFPDNPRQPPAYNTADATLWYINAVLQFLKYTRDFEFVKKKLWETLKEIVEWHVKGTTHDIKMDEDGLLQHGAQLTWMDVMINGKPVTPRNGKAVEIQALWHNALKTMELLATKFKEENEAEKYRLMAEKARESFNSKFWCNEKEYLFDVVSNGYRDDTLRPNQVFAVALDFPLIENEKAEKIVTAVQEKLLTPYGLRTLPPDHPNYVGVYLGDFRHRDLAYHNGTAWAWLLGPFTTAFLKTKRHESKWRKYAFKNFLEKLFRENLFNGGLGSLNEIFDGNFPHHPRGCIAQAWSVAEPLRAYVEDVLLIRPPYEKELLSP
ncbi:MAG TPA: glycogen debranching protein [Candidatus Bathyarchaeota archaeon]|nr:glycogen debranching protein [Candidatus Bathyarchaeota archaeon]